MIANSSLAAIAIVTALVGNSTFVQAGTTNDQDNYEGDRVTFAINVQAQLMKLDGTIDKPVCLPAGTRIWGVGNYIKAPTGILFRNKNEFQSCDSSQIDVPVNSELLIENININPPTPNRSGLTYGVLAVPFKYHLSGQKDFTGSATIGPYLGYRADPEGSLGFGISFVGFLGASNIAVAQPGSASTQNLAGFSYGVGLIGTVKGNFQLGGVLGFDRVSANSNYQDNGKPWLALELGYSFLQ